MAPQATLDRSASQCDDADERDVDDGRANQRFVDAQRLEPDVVGGAHDVEDGDGRDENRRFEQ